MTSRGPSPYTADRDPVDLLDEGSRCVGLGERKGEPVASPTPLTFEQLNQGYGYVLYSTHFNQPLKGRLEIPGLRDYATIYVDGERVGELNRCFNQYAMEIDIPFNATLDILVENMGRINYGEEIVRNTKGIISSVKINGSEISDWKMYKLPMDRMPALSPTNLMSIRMARPR